jgi:hypothetical protein
MNALMIAYIEIVMAEMLGIPREAWVKVPPNKRLTILKWLAERN